MKITQYRTTWTSGETTYSDDRTIFDEMQHLGFRYSEIQGLIADMRDRGHVLSTERGTTIERVSGGDTCARGAGSAPAAWHHSECPMKADVELDHCGHDSCAQRRTCLYA